MSGIWDSIRGFALGTMESGLEGLHMVLQPLAGVHAWGWAIIALTVVIRVLLLPLAIKQIRSMRAMQAIQPKMKEIQKKHKVDRELMKKDPDQYRAKKQKLNEEMMALYQREGVNPMASCLPLLAQAPIFIALFWVLRESDDIANQPFYFFTSFISADSPESGLGALVSTSGWPGLLLIAMMIVTMFVMQKQMMARQASSGADNPMAQQQKIMLYVLPVFLGVISWQLPLGVLLYWVTTNAWQGTQQAIMLREVKHEAEEGTLGERPGGEHAKGAPGRKKGAGPGAKGSGAKGSGAKGSGSKGSGSTGQGSKGQASKDSGSKPANGSAKGANAKGASGKAGSGSSASAKGGTSGAAKGPKGGANGSGKPQGGANGRSGAKGGSGSSSRSGHLPRRPSRS